MPRQEFLVKIGDSGGSRDGDVIAAKPPGRFFTAAEVESAIAAKAQPEGMPDLLWKRVHEPAIRAKVRGYGGVDTNWGFKDLMHHGVVEVEATEQEVAELLEPVLETVERPANEGDAYDALVAAGNPEPSPGEVGAEWSRMVAEGVTFSEEVIREKRRVGLDYAAIVGPARAALLRNRHRHVPPQRRPETPPGLARKPERPGRRPPKRGGRGA